VPIYEYHCDDCDSIFELLRSPRESTKGQPCPRCDADARRIISREFVPFVMRDGLPRKVPDNGKFKHLGRYTDAPYSTDAPGQEGGQWTKDLKEQEDKRRAKIEHKSKTNDEVSARTVSGKHGVTRKTRVSKSKK
jgi:putative FmdB family regulatory protein